MPWLIPNRSIKKDTLAGKAAKLMLAADTSAEEKIYYKYVDTPDFSYGLWKHKAGGSIATFDTKPTEKVAIIGAGLAGLSSAYELLKCGVEVSLFEASDRIGGRLYSKKFSKSDPEIAELGAMRFPPSEELLFDYFNQFKIATTPDFPDPLTVNTLISYKNNTYNVPANGDIPAEFDTVHAGWNDFAENGATIEYTDHTGTQKKVTLAAPNDIADALMIDADGNPKSTKVDPVEAWKSYMEVFLNKSLFDGLVTIFNGSNPPGGKAWNYPEDYERFASLGTGFGGFGPLYQVGFLEIMRLITNGLEVGQVFVPKGIETVAHKLYSEDVVQPDGTTAKVSDNTTTNCPIGGVYKSGDKIVVLDKSGKQVPGSPFDRVIVATTQRSMEIDSNLGLFDPFTLPEVGNVEPTMPTEVAQSIRDIHIMNSSKVFIRTKDKFWTSLKEGTRCILSDSLSANLYTLDYGGDYGVVLVSYVWGDQSIKQISFQNPKERLAMLKEALAPFAPDFIEHLNPLNDDYDQNVQFIDWELKPHYYGAFKLTRPGQDHYVQSAFFHYLEKSDSNAGQVYLAGDSISWTGGWTEGALQTGMNAACSLIQSIGGTLNSPGYNPMVSIKPDLYDYNQANG